MVEGTALIDRSENGTCAPMAKISGYDIADTLYKSSSSLVYRGRREGEQQSIILKVLNDLHAKPDDVERFRREYERAQRLRSLTQVVHVLELKNAHNYWIIEFEDFGGASLTELALAGTLTVGDFLSLALKLVDAVGQLHQQQIIHKDINSSNVVLNPATGQLKIIDFGIAEERAQSNRAPQPTVDLEGTLTHIAPEQTGRTGQTLDHRADFYALGVTFYELLTGQLPFQGEDALELIHSHIARQPIQPHERRANIPATLSRIVLKLMAKDPDARYQSAMGIHADLTEALEQWQATGRIELPELARNDYSSQFRIPEKLYGREAAYKQLLAAFQRATTGRRAMTLVTGAAGSGKSALVNAVSRQVIEQGGYFVAGKFDQLQSSSPYLALSQALNELVDQLLTTDETTLAHWRDQLLSTLGANASVMIDILPKLALILGPQPSTSTLLASERQNRIRLALQRFVHLFATVEHPLVLFLDDLQWADQGTLNVLHFWLTDAQLGHLLIIGSYRVDEVDTAHPLMTLWNELAAHDVSMETITLTPFALGCVQHLLADTLGSDGDVVDDDAVLNLAQVILDKTGGNPYFVRELLQRFCQRQLIWWDYAQNCWRWEHEQIQAHEVTDNLVDLLADKVQLLSTEVQRALKIASCIGNRFDLPILARALDASQEQTSRLLEEALSARLILPVVDERNMAGGEPTTVASLRGEPPENHPAHQKPHHRTATYRFVHDGIQAAVYRLVTAARKPYYHRQIALALQAELLPNERDQQIFEIADHLNLAASLITEQTEVDSVTEWNLRAGNRARATGANEAALTYIRQGIHYLGNGVDGWSRRYNLTLRLYNLAASVAFMNGYLDEMAGYCQSVLTHARSLPDKQPVYLLQIQVSFAQDHPSKTMALALHVLSELGIHFPEEPTEADVLAELQAIRAMLDDYAIATLRELPPMTDPQRLMAMHIIAAIQSAANFTNSPIYALTIFQMIRNSLHYGNTPIVAQGYAKYGRILHSICGDLDAGYQFCLLALDLAQKGEDAKALAEVTLTMYATVMIWKVHIAETLPHLRKVQQMAWEYGSIETAIHGVTIHAMHAMYIGSNLGKLKEELLTALTTFGPLEFQYQITIFSIIQHMIEQLMQDASQPFTHSGETILLMASDYQWTLGYYHIQKAALSLYFDAPEDAFRHISQAQEIENSPFATTKTSLLNFYGSLSRLAIYEQQPAETQREFLAQLTTNQAMMKQWAADAPDNYLHKYLLVEAEHARICGDDKDARVLYEQAFDAATTANYIHEAGLIAERAAGFYFSQEVDHLGQHYLQMAYRAYQRWGATAKMLHMEKCYPQELIAYQETSAYIDKETTIRKGQRREMTSKQATSLDFISIVKAAETILGETELEQLLKKMMHLVIENAGAERGVLILEEQGEWMLTADATTGRETVMMRRSLPIQGQESGYAEAGQLIVGAVDYVLRTRELLLIGDVVNDPRFSSAGDVNTSLPKSLLCMPLLNQGHISGVLYLENRLSEDVFHPDRIEVLKLLSSQMAISLDNARLYDKLRTEIIERTKIEHELANHRDHLEELVEQRTVELTTTLEHLKNTQQHLVEAEKMAALGSLVAGIAHEINTPIGIGVTAASTLTEETQQLLLAVETEQLRRSTLTAYLQTAQTSSRLIHNNLQRAANLIQSFKQIAVDRTTHEQRTFAVSEYIRETLHSLEPQLNRTNHIVQILGDEQLTIRSFPGDFSQIITNLVMNSLMHGFEDDEVGYISFTIEQDIGGVVIRYSDSGKGIPAENLKRIFDPFFTTARHQGGTGLGMHIVYNLITQKLGGTIRCESEVGHGVTFIIGLPYTAVSTPDADSS